MTAFDVRSRRHTSTHTHTHRHKPKGEGEIERRGKESVHNTRRCTGHWPARIIDLQVGYLPPHLQTQSCHLPLQSEPVPSHSSIVKHDINPASSCAKLHISAGEANCSWSFRKQILCNAKVYRHTQSASTTRCSNFLCLQDYKPSPGKRHDKCSELP